MNNKIATRLIGIGLLAVLLPTSGWAQKVGKVKRIVSIEEGRVKKVKETDSASIERPSESMIRPVKKGQDLLADYTLGLENQLWMELKIKRPGLKGHAILAEAGSYRIETLNLENEVYFRLQEGLMTVKLKKGIIGLHFKGFLLKILGTKLILDNNASVSHLFVKKGRIIVQRNGQEILNQEGENIGWNLSSNQAPQPMSAEDLTRWGQQYKDVIKKMSTPFFKRPLVRFGLVAIAVVASYCSVEGCGATARGSVIINVPN